MYTHTHTHTRAEEEEGTKGEEREIAIYRCARAGTVPWLSRVSRCGASVAEAHVRT